MRGVIPVLCGVLLLPVLWAHAVAGYAATSYEAQALLHGNVQSKIYHNSSCRYYHCKACTAVFQSVAEALASGYRACKVCGG